MNMICNATIGSDCIRLLYVLFPLFCRCSTVWKFIIAIGLLQWFECFGYRVDIVHGFSHVIRNAKVDSMIHNKDTGIIGCEMYTTRFDNFFVFDKMYRWTTSRCGLCFCCLFAFATIWAINIMYATFDFVDDNRMNMNKTPIVWRTSNGFCHVDGTLRNGTKRPTTYWKKQIRISDSFRWWHYWVLYARLDVIRIHSNGTWLVSATSGQLFVFLTQSNQSSPRMWGMCWEYRCLFVCDDDSGNSTVSSVMFAQYKCTFSSVCLV